MLSTFVFGAQLTSFRACCFSASLIVVRPILTCLAWAGAVQAPLLFYICLQLRSYAQASNNPAVESTALIMLL